MFSIQINLIDELSATTVLAPSSTCRYITTENMKLIYYCTGYVTSLIS